MESFSNWYKIRGQKETKNQICDVSLLSPQRWRKERPETPPPPPPPPPPPGLFTSGIPTCTWQFYVN